MNMQYNGYTVTDEQQIVIEQANQGQSLKMQAVAGSGKTSTLGAVSTVLSHQNGLYVAFNKSIQQEADRAMPSNVSARTAHSLAYRAKAIPFLNQGKLGKCYPNVLAKQFNIHQIPPLTSVGLAGVALETVTRYCYSADIEIKDHHVPIKVFRDAGYRGSDLGEVRSIILGHAKRIWAGMIDLRNPTPITHDVYVKLWALDNPRIHADFILFDEAQDANPVITDVIMKQDAQLIFVGDEYQQIYSWRGADNALAKIQLPNYWLTQSFRFGPAIANVANDILHNQLKADVTVKGFDRVNSLIEELPTNNTDCIISRTNAGVISNAFAGIDSDEKPHINGGTAQLLGLIRGIKQLKAGRRSEHQELRVFPTYCDLIEYSETDQGKELAVPLNLISKYGIDDLISVIDQVGSISASEADYTLTTAHKSKGLEWENVKLDNDFRNMKKDDGSANPLWQAEEANLLYVAATRAMHTLDCSQVDDIAKLCALAKSEVAA